MLKDILKYLFFAFRRFSEIKDQNLFSVSHYEYDNENGEVTVVYNIIGKRTELRKQASKILNDKKILVAFSRHDVAEIAISATRQIIRTGGKRIPIIDDRLKSEQKYKFYPYVATLFATFFICSIVLSHRIMIIHGQPMPGGIFIFPMTYFLIDIVQEVYGYKRTRQLIWASLLCQVAFSISIFLSMQYPHAPFWEHQTEYNFVLGHSMQTVFANLLATFGGIFSNAYIMAKLKIKFNGQHLWLRTIGATTIGELIYTMVWVLLVFGIRIEEVEIFHMIFSMYIFKAFYEVVTTPFTYILVYILKTFEGIDVYDKYTNFNPFSLEV